MLAACLNLVKLGQVPQLSGYKAAYYPFILAAQEERPKGFERFFDKGKASSSSKTEKKATTTDKKEEEESDEKDKEKDSKNKEKDEKGKGKQAMNEEDDLKTMPPPLGSKLLITAILGSLLYYHFAKKDQRQLSKQELTDMIRSKSVGKLSAHRSNKGEITLYVLDKSQRVAGVYKTLDYDSLSSDIEKIQVDASVAQADMIKIDNTPAGNLPLLPFIIGALLLLMLIPGGRAGNMRNIYRGTTKMNQGGPVDKKKPLGGLGDARNVFDNIFGFGASKAIEYGDANKVEVSFKDVAGMEGPKEEIQEFVEYLKNPKKFHKLGAKIPKGALLAGPPGTGKTLLAKACAGEAGVPFFATSGSEFVEMFVGVGAARVRDLFKKAKAKSPAIIFIDEIDAIGKHRAKIGYNDERESTLNQIFVELDGFGTDTNVVVFAATNRKDALDRALIRPGRFDRIIEINLPSMREREQIFSVHLKGITVNSKVAKADVAKKLSALTMGMSGADISSVCNEAAILAARRNKKSVDMDDFYEAYDRVLTGLKRKLPLTEYDKKITAFHESGHAIVGWFLNHSQPVLKVLAC